MTPVLSGYGLRLEPLSLEHLPALEPVAADPEAWTWMSERGETPAELRAFVERALGLVAAGTAQAWTVVLEAGNCVAGSTRFADIDPHHHRCELGWTFFDRQLRGRGINPRTKLLQLTYAFEGLGMRRVALKTHHNNLRSQRAMLKLGAQPEGVFRNHMIMPDGSSRDTHWFSIIDADWPALKASLLERIDAEPLP